MPELNPSPFLTFPVLQTERLTLREIRLSDAEQILQMRSNGQVNRFIPRPAMETEEEAVQLVEKVQQAYAAKQAMAWAAVLRNSDKIIGTCGFNSIEHSNLRAEIGGELTTEYWGKHLAVEAVTKIVRFGLENLGLHTIEAKVSPENRGAIFILTQLGFVKEAHYKDRGYHNLKFIDMAVYTKFNPST